MANNPKNGAAISGFVPLFDPLLQNPDYGLAGAAIFGQIFRWCQGPDGQAPKTYYDISTILGVSERTVRRHVPRLVADGWLVVDPGRGRGVPNTYSLGPRIHSPWPPGTPVPDQKDRPLTPQQQWVQVLGEITALDPAVKRNAGRLAKIAKELREAGYTADQILGWYAPQESEGPATWWYIKDWRGKKGQPPTPEQVLETVGQAAKFHKPLGVLNPKDLADQVAAARAQVQAEREAKK